MTKSRKKQGQGLASKQEAKKGLDGYLLSIVEMVMETTYLALNDEKTKLTALKVPELITLIISNVAMNLLIVAFGEKGELPSSEVNERRRAVKLFLDHFHESFTESWDLFETSIANESCPN